MVPESFVILEADSEFSARLPLTPAPMTITGLSAGIVESALLHSSIPSRARLESETRQPRVGSIDSVGRLPLEDTRTAVGGECHW